MGCVVSLERRSRAASFLQPYINGAQSIELWKHGAIVGYIDMHLMQMRIRERSGSLSIYSVEIIDAQEYAVYMHAKKKSKCQCGSSEKTVYIRIALQSDSCSTTSASESLNVYVHKTGAKMHKRTWLCCCFTALVTKQGQMGSAETDTETIVYQIKKWQ